MDIIFESGSKERPKGHAILYFRSATDSEEVWATYMVLLPISVDISKYVPPFLMNQVGEIGAKDLSAFAFPPAPERVDGYAYLEGLAASRDDDLLFGGTFNSTDVASALVLVTDAVQQYAEVYASVVGLPGVAEEEVEEEETGEASVNEVLYGLMSDGDKLTELTKLVGRLRFSSEGGEDALVNEAEADIRVLVGHLPGDHQIGRLIDAAKAEDSRGAKLADLYLRRSFHLIREEYVKLGQVETEIKVMEADESSG